MARLVQASQGDPETLLALFLPEFQDPRLGPWGQISLTSQSCPCPGDLGVPLAQRSVQTSDLSARRHRFLSDHLQSKLFLDGHFCQVLLGFLLFLEDLVFLDHQECLMIQVIPFLPLALLHLKLLSHQVALGVP